MSASRVRVRQPVSLAGLVLLLACAGLTWGLVEGSIFRLLLLMQRTFSMFIVDTLGKGWVVLGIALVLIWLPMLCQRYRNAFLAAGAAGGAYSIGYGLAWEIMLAGVVEWTWKGWIEDLAGIAIAGLALGMLAMLAVLISRTFLFTLVSQDGTACNRCGYAVGRTDAAICPECGSERDTSTIAPLGGRLANWLGTRSRGATVALVTVVAVLLLWLTWLQWPYMQFRQQLLKPPAVRVDTFHSDFPLFVLSAKQPLNELGEDAGVVVDIGRRNPFSPVRMRVRTGAGTGHGGTPRIICELRGRQMRSVLRDGVPQELIDRLVEAAREHHWSPERQTTNWENPETVWVQPP